MDSFSSALARLDPANRALLDLSLRRGMKPEEIGDLLGTDSGSVVVAREAALEQLANELDMDDVAELDQVRARLAELPAEIWTGTAERPQLRVVAEEERAEQEPPPPTVRSRSRLPLLLAILGVAAVVLVIVLASNGGSEKAKSTAQPKAPTPTPSSPAKPAKHKPPVAKQVKLTALVGASGATGSAALTQGGKRLTIDAGGLPDPHGGAYQVWLYDSVVDTFSLVKVRGTKLALDLTLPSNASHYRYVDISLEPADGNPNHSGESVLRVPLAKLSG
jgi:hypothetical protein